MRYWTFILGTRPEIIKCAPLIRMAQKNKQPIRIIHTGQHYDHCLDAVFFEELDLPLPTVNLGIHGTQFEFFGGVFLALATELEKNRPSVVIVQGDTNSAFAGAFVADRLGIPVAHLEAGLRSFDRAMPEEINRILIDAIASRLYVPTSVQMMNVTNEGIAGDRVVETGNTIADAVREHACFAADAALSIELSSLIVKPYCIITLHRPALVDNPERLERVLSVLAENLKRHNLKGVFLVHPRTKKMIEESGAGPFDAIHYIEPVGYFSMLKLLTSAEVIVTDSGGLQEEAALLQVPCITVRENTERPETVCAGGNILTGFDPELIREAFDALLKHSIGWQLMYNVPNPTESIFTDLHTWYS